VRRILLVLAVALVMAAMLVASAMPVLARATPRQVCNFQPTLGERCEFTTSSSGNINGNFHFKP
jgi:hypothetical protein